MSGKSGKHSPADGGTCQSIDRVGGADSRDRAAGRADRTARARAGGADRQAPPPQAPILLGLSAGRRFQLILKHGGDRLFALLALALLAPLVLVLAVSVRMSGRPVLIRDRRLGRDDREFDLLRFRCERPAPAGPRAVEGPSLTRAGRVLRRTGLDYLPQLFNLLKGELSVVGPRPQRPEVTKILDAGRGLRARMRPGITGLGQLAALRGPVNPDARREADDYYVRTWSLWLDVRIVARTVFAALRPSGD